MYHFEDQLNNDSHQVRLTQVLNLLGGKENVIEISFLFVPLLIFCLGTGERKITKNHFETDDTQ